MKRRNMLKALTLAPALAGLNLMSGARNAQASIPLNTSRPYCEPASIQSPFSNLIETRIFTVDPNGNGDYTSLIDALADISAMTRDRQNRVRVVLADGVYNIDSVGVEGLRVPSYTRVQGNIYDKTLVRIERTSASIQGRAFEIGAGSVLEGLHIKLPYDSSTSYSYFFHPVWINAAYPDAGVIQNCKLEGGIDTVIVEGGSIGFMYDVDFTCNFDGIRGGFNSQPKAIRLTMVNCRGVHIGRANSVVRTGLTWGWGNSAADDSLFDIYRCTFSREYTGTQPLGSGNPANLVGPGAEWMESGFPKTIPIRMRSTTCRIIVPASGVSSADNLATVFMAFKSRFEIDNCQFVIDETLSGPQNMHTAIFLEGAEGYIHDSTTNAPGRVVNSSTNPIYINPLL
jgi:hypothetical protein